MSTILSYLLVPEVLLTLIITINPLGVMPAFISLTSGYGKEESYRILRQAMIFSFIVLTFSAITGEGVLNSLGLSTYALQIAGGLLFFKYGYASMNGTEVEENRLEDNPSLVPLGFPIIAGPGTITALIFFSSNGISGNEGISTASLIVGITICLLITFIILKNADNITSFLGKQASNAIIKITGLLIMTIGVQLILGGISSWLVITSNI